MEIKRKDVRIVKCHPNKPHNFFKLSDAYLKLFNEDEDLKLLSLTNIPLDLKTITSFLKSASARELEYYVAISSDKDIIGISVFESDLIKGFNIVEVVVDSDYRGCGVGKSLIDKGIELAIEKGFKAIDIDVFSDNKSMLILLLKMDFKPVKIENSVRFDGEDLVHLKRHIK